jgi:hypothetical protein
MSAFLASLVGKLGEQIFCTAVTEGTLAQAGGVDEATLCEQLTRPTRAPSPSAPHARCNHRATVVDGLAPAKVACSGSNVSDQTDGTTVDSSTSRRRGSRQRSIQGTTRVREVSTTTFGITQTVVDTEHIS